MPSGAISAIDACRRGFLRFTAEGRFAGELGRFDDISPTFVPRFLCLDASGNHFVSDGGARVHQFSADGGYVGNTGALGPITAVSALTYGADGHLYVADIGGIAPRLRARVVGNPVTGEAYLLLDVPKNPPPPIALGFTPNRTYVPSMPSPLATVQDRLPAVLERAEATLQILGEIVSRIPGSLDRSDRFFTNVEGIIKKSELPALSADSRKFFTTTSAQIEQITSELEGVIGPDGKLVTFVDEARAAIKAADLPATNQSTRAAADKVTLAADDIRRSLPAIRDSLEQLRQLARQLEEQPESVVFGPRPPVKP